MKNAIGLVLLLAVGSANFLYWAQPVDLGLPAPFANYDTLATSDEDRVLRTRCSILDEFNKNSKLYASELREIRRCYRSGRLK